MNNLSETESNAVYNGFKIIESESSFNIPIDLINLINEFCGKNTTVCIDCNISIFYPVFCDRCIERDDIFEPHCRNCIYRNYNSANKEWSEFYDTVCDHCHGYLLENPEG